VILLALIAAHHQTANSLVRQQRFIHGQIGQIGLYRCAFLRVEWLTGFEGIQRSRRVARVIRERVRRQTRRQVVSHGSHITQRCSYRASGRPAGPGSAACRVGPSSQMSMPIRWLSSSPPMEAVTHVDR